MMFIVRIWIAFLLCTLLFACREKNDVPTSQTAIPADSLISPDKMILILADVHVLEASMLLERNDGQGSRDKPRHFYQGVFNKYHISPERYDQNLAFYRKNPEDFEKMYEKVIEVLEKRQKTFLGTE